VKRIIASFGSSWISLMTSLIAAILNPLRMLASKAVEGV
jgi:hypothetical protein